MMRWLRSLPILSQTLLLLLATLVASSVVNVLLILALPAPRPDSYAMRDITQALTHDVRSAPLPPDMQLVIATSNGPPSAEGTRMISSPTLSDRLARGLGMPIERTRLLYEPDQSKSWPFRASDSDSGVPLRLGEPFFYNSAIAAVQLADGRWRIVRTPERPLFTRWQQRSLVAFFLSLLAVVPLAILFARQLASPIRRFADAASQVGASIAAPAVPVEGAIELRLAAQALNSTQVRLTDTLAERTAMIGAIAHDLRTPLARIAFRMESAPDGLRTAVLADIEQMRAMIAATISFVVKGTQLGVFRRIDLCQLLERIVDEGRAMEQPVELTGEEAWVVGDSVALERLFQNVVDNAIAYAGSAEITIAHRAGRIVVTVSDRGPGLSNAMLEAVFKPFNRGEPSRSRSTGGVGLGLSIARSIALAHDGTLVSRNREGGGLEIIAEFPAAQPHVAAPIRVPVSA